MDAPHAEIATSPVKPPTPAVASSPSTTPAATSPHPAPSSSASAPVAAPSPASSSSPPPPQPPTPSVSASSASPPAEPPADRAGSSTEPPPPSQSSSATTTAPTPMATTAESTDRPPPPPSTATAVAPPVNAHAANASSNGGAPTTTTATTAPAVTPTVPTMSAPYAQNKPPATIAPAGENKVHPSMMIAPSPGTTMPTTAPKKEPRRKASGTESTAKAPRKPSPRPRAPKAAAAAGADKAEKRKPAAARKNAASNVAPKPPTSMPSMTSVTTGNTSAPMTTTMASQPPSMYATTASTLTRQLSTQEMAAQLQQQHQQQQQQQQEVPPAQDNELRKAYLQRIYRQLLASHQNQDDATIRRVATNIEMEVCRRAATRQEYATMLSQELHRLMQTGLTSTTTIGMTQMTAPHSVPSQSAAMRVPSQDSAVAQSQAMSTSSNALSQGRESMSATTTPSTESRPADGSFMSLLSSQTPMQTYDVNQKPPQFGAPMDNSANQQLPSVGNPMQPGFTPGSTPMYAQHPGHMPTPGGEVHDPSRMVRPQQPPAMGLQEFAMQFQHFEKNALIELLWNQRNSLMQWQRRAAQLEMQMNARQGMPGMPGMPPVAVPPSPSGIPASYYNASPRPGYTPGVPPSLSAEAEAQRAMDRRNSRLPQQSQQTPAYPQYTPGQNSYGSSPGSAGRPSTGSSPPTPNSQQGAVNPTVYWEKVRYLKEAYLRPLCLAHQALAQHPAPPQSSQSTKADIVKHNIGLAINLLSETPSASKPNVRPLEVLESIERFIHTTVVPIVRKIQPQAQMPGGQPGMMVGPAPTYPTPNAPLDSARMPTTTQQSTLPQPPMTATMTPPPTNVAPAKSGNGASKTQPAKAPTKAGGRKSPSNNAKKTATPKNGAKSTARKSPARGTKQTPAPTLTKVEPEQKLPALSGFSSGGSAMLHDQEIRDDLAKETPVKTGSGVGDDDGLNDFSDFADLDFGDDMQDPLSKVQFNKENASVHNSRKRSIEDV